MYGTGMRIHRSCFWGDPDPTWLSDKTEDPSELNNLADANPEELEEMQGHLIEKIKSLNLPGNCAQEQLERLELA